MNDQDAATGKTYSDTDMSEEAKAWREQMSAKKAAGDQTQPGQEGFQKAGSWLTRFYNSHRTKIGMLAGAALALGAEAGYRAYQERKAEKTNPSRAADSSPM